ncbi:tetratricopeptide repeat protein [Cryptosporangium japonicum]|uniref:TIR domain-containing protein n=1 Tax=Cryptosporangium japonicum TaxID=80872 RepID=A0ABN0UFC4_9ACTN
MVSSRFRVPFTGRPGEGYLEDYLHSATVESAIDRYGLLKIRRAALNSAVRDLARRPKLRGYPPRIFVSYRWDDEAGHEWIRNLVHHLRERGYHVELDQEHLDVIGPHGIEIGPFVARVIDCHIFLRVVTRKLLADDAREWLVEEQQLATLAEHTGQRQIDVTKETRPGPRRRSGAFSLDEMLKDGHGVTVSAFPERRAVETIDLSADPSDLTPLNRLAEYRGLVLSPDEEARLLALIERADPLLDAGDGDGDTVLQLLAQHENLAATDEYDQLRANALALVGATSAAVATADAVLVRGSASYQTSRDLCFLLLELGRPRVALRALGTIRRPGSALDWSIAGLIGDILDDLGSYQAAINHYRHTASAPGEHHNEARAAALGNLGYVYLIRLGDAPSALPLLRAAVESDPRHESAWANLVTALAALDRLEDARAAAHRGLRQVGRSESLRTLAQDPETPLPLPDPVRLPPATHACGTCGAGYVLTSTVRTCTACGTSYADHPWCPCCRHPATLSDSGSRCPTCLDGVVTPA